MESIVLLPKMEPISNNDWDHYLSQTAAEYLQTIRESLISCNRFLVDERFNKLIYWYAFDEVSRFAAWRSLESSTVLYRARVYRQDDIFDRMTCPERNKPFYGYGKEESYVPPADSVKDGRANPANIPYLYASSDIDTCVNEVNAQQSEWVSVAKIIVKEKLHLFNIATTLSAIDAVSLEKSKWINSFVLELSSAFQSPSNGKFDYLLCQYVSEYIKNWRFDGIAFNSAKAPYDKNQIGINYTIFNYEKCEAESSELIFIESVSRVYGF